MATPEINENCHMQNDPHRCKIKLEKFHFDILCCYGLITERFLGRQIPPPSPPPGKVELSESGNINI